MAVISATGDLDEASAARLLRWCDVRLHRKDIGQESVDHLLVDVSHARVANPSALAVLDHARAEARRRDVGIHLVGVPMSAGSTEQAHRHLDGWSVFLSIDAARAALAAAEGDNARDARLGPVDPDAIVLTTVIHDRLR
jgi:anti-anti-sigma regulatory factor